jgi:hypothetical protein
MFMTATTIGTASIPKANQGRCPHERSDNALYTPTFTVRSKPFAKGRSSLTFTILQSALIWSLSCDKNTVLCSDIYCPPAPYPHNLNEAAPQ